MAGDAIKISLWPGIRVAAIHPGVCFVVSFLNASKAKEYSEHGACADP
jgi:hypothetical protein